MKSKGYNNVPVAAAATHSETRAVNKLSLPLDAVFVVVVKLDLSSLSDIVSRGFVVWLYRGRNFTRSVHIYLY